MSRIPHQFAAIALAFGLGAMALADDKKPTEMKPADWSKFASAGEITGEVTKVSEDGFTLKATGSIKGVKAGPRGKSPEYMLTFAEAGLVRWKTLPPKGTDAKGKPVQYSEKERTELRKPSSVPGYAAERADIKVGQIVEATLVRPKEIAADKASIQDFKVKYAMILKGDQPAPAEEKKPEAKKKEKDKDK